MHYLETEFIKYKNNQLYVDDINVADIAKEFGTPLYIYSKNHFIKQYKEFENALQGYKSQNFLCDESKF